MLNKLPPPFRQRPLILIPIILIVVLALALLLSRGAQTFGIAAAPSLTGSGIIQADENIVATEIAGRVVELDADEGDSVTPGQILAKLDSVLLAAQLDQAQAALAMTQANLAKLQLGARAEEVRQAQAARAQAIAKRDGAKQALEDAETTRSQSQDLNLRIDAARAALDAAEHRALSLNLLAQAATLERAYYERTVGELEQGIDIPTPAGIVTKFLSPQRLDDLRLQAALAGAKEWSAWAAQSAAFAQRDAARADLDALLAQQREPNALSGQAGKARTELQVAEAGVNSAQAKLDALTSGTRAENITAAKAQVAQAQAARDSLKAQLDKMTLKAPREGIVSERLLNLGEMAAPGSAVFHVVNLNQMTLTIYVPESQLGRVQAGSRADVTTDSFPGRVFAGTISFVSPQPEFTPKNVATKDQRTAQVFAVKITIDNSADRALKPGMPADAAIK